MSATVKVIERFFHSDGTIEGPDEFEGPRISVKVIRDGEVGGKAVKKGQTISLCERDAIREMCWNHPPVIEIDSSKLTRMGSILLRSRGYGYYEEPVGTKGVIPKIKVVGTEDDALVGYRVLRKGEVQELPEDVVWGLLQSPVHVRFDLAPGAEFTLPPETLRAMVADMTFDVNHHS
jgi:hypothetical protein